MKPPQAIIVSQGPRGGIPVAEDYEDPAYSGGHMNRPALKRLLNDIEKRRIGVVVEIERLTRSLTDFSKTTEAFERVSLRRKLLTGG